jgi:hypothetical protein
MVHVVLGYWEAMIYFFNVGHRLIFVTEFPAMSQYSSIAN